MAEWGEKRSAQRIGQTRRVASASAAVAAASAERAKVTMRAVVASGERRAANKSPPGSNVNTEQEQAITVTINAAVNCRRWRRARTTYIHTDTRRLEGATKPASRVAPPVLQDDARTFYLLPAKRQGRSVTMQPDKQRFDRSHREHRGYASSGVIAAQRVDSAICVAFGRGGGRPEV